MNMMMGLGLLHPDQSFKIRYGLILAWRSLLNGKLAKTKERT